MNDLLNNAHVRAGLYFTDQGHYLLAVKGRNNEKEVTTKTLRDAEVRAAFTRAGQDSGWMMPGVIRKGNNALGPWYVYLCMATLQKVTIKGSGRMVIPLPGLVMVGAGDHHYLFAVDIKDAGKFNPSALVLCQAPFPNVHSDGKICWGNNQAPRVDAGSAQQARDLFFESPFNADLTKDKSRKYPADCRMMLAELDLKDVYPVKDLVKLHQASTLEERLKQIVGDMEAE